MTSMSGVTDPPDPGAGADFIDFSGAIADHARDRPNDPALISDGVMTTWSDFDRSVARLANGLRSNGIGSGDRVAIIASPSVRYIEVIFGVLRIGGCFVPLSPMATTHQLLDMVRDSGARIVFISADMRELSNAIVNAAASSGIRIVAIDFEAEGWLPYESLLREPDSMLPSVRLHGQLDFNVIYSSGTTGVPKGIVHDYATRSQLLVSIRRMGFRPGCRTLIATPLYSNLTIAVVLPTIALGGTIVLLSKFSTAEYLHLAQLHRVTNTMLVPTQYRRLLADPNFSDFDLSSFELKLCTSAPLRPELKKEIVERWPGHLVEVYGMSEGAGVCALDANSFPDKLDTVGRPTSDSEFLILDEQGEVLKPGQIGEIVSRSSSMMSGYHNRPEATAAILWHDNAGRQFFRTGDLGYFDSDGFLHLSDRKKDMIISGGFNVYASDLEDVLMRHPDILEAAVVAAPSEEWGETPAAAVVLKDGTSGRPEDIRAWANERLGKAQKISRVVLLDALPRSAIGKVLKRELRDKFAAHAPTTTS